MNRPITAKINAKNHLEIGGCDCVELAQEFGTPLYVLDEVTLRGKCREYRTALKDRYPNSLVIYASKALCTTAVLKIMQDEGLGADVASGGELFTARRAGVAPENIYFHGNNKSEKELSEALEAGVGRIVVDNLTELSNLDRITAKLKKKARILFRVNPGIDAHTHEFIQTGKVDSKFGIARENIVAAVKQAKGMNFIEFVGLHAHIGSQIFDVKPFLAEVDVLISLAIEVEQKAGEKVTELNVGGGVGIDYLGNENVPSVDSFVKQVVEHLEEKCDEGHFTKPKLILEPGRSIVGNAGVTLYTVGSVKEIPGIRTYVAVDGGMADNPRPILYAAKYDAVLANKAGSPKIGPITVAGRFCESGDKLIENLELPEVEARDLLAVFCTGAYNYSMASNYNRVTRPAMVLLNSGSAKLIVKRESYDDLVQCETGAEK